MNNTKLRKVAIVGANRIPFAKSNTAYHEQSNQQLLTAALKGLVDRYGLQGKHVDEVVAGAVLKHSKDFNLTRESVLDSGLASTTSAIDIQQACGTGLEAAILVANKIALGQIDVGIAGGTDTTSDAPIAVGKGMQRAMMDFNKARSTGEQLKAAMKLLNPKNLIPQIPANGEPRTGLSMGQHCELTTQRWSISREDQDALALASHKNLAKAYDEGFFDDLITPYQGLERDNVLRPDTTVEKLAKLGPVFDREKGTLTAANSSNLTDGASCVLLATEEWAKANNLPVLAYLVNGQASAVEFRNEEEGLLMAP
ncbi:MAG: acetyl-CoA C-acyltransferase, partial [Salinisphaeraceae bacterium]|nr:acetyl-CoA C-acyltransferase [Salinisphaeraceae bacterium]